MKWLLIFFPIFKGFSLDLKKKLSATLIPAFLLRLCCSKEKKHTNKFFLAFLLLFFSFLLRKNIKEIPFLEQQNLLTLSELGGIFFFLAENACYLLNSHS